MKKDRPAEGVTLTAKQYAALAHLLAGDTAAATAKALKLNPVSLHRWQRQPAFAEALRKGQDQSLSTATNRLKTYVGAAIDRLHAELDSPENPASVRVQASQVLLVQALRYFEHQDVMAQVKEMRATLDQIEAERGVK